MQQINEQIFWWVQGVVGQYGWLDTVFNFWANGLGIALLLLIIGYFVFKFERAEKHQHRDLLQEVGFVLMVGLSAWAISEVINILYPVARPFIALKEMGFVPLHTHGAMDSFPSGHASVYMAVAIATWLLDRRVGIVAVVLAVLVAGGRVLVGVHWPFDVLVGVLLGAMVALGLFSFHLKIHKYHKKKKAAKIDSDEH